MTHGESSKLASRCLLIWMCAAPILAATSHPMIPGSRPCGTGVSAAGQSAISAAIGRDQAAYRAVPIPNALRLEIPQSQLAVNFTRQGIRVQIATTASWNLSLCGYGNGSALEALTAVTPSADANRVEYGRGALTEWYVNGPAGIEQGFTLGRPPSQPAAGPLTIALL